MQYIPRYFLFRRGNLFNPCITRYIASFGVKNNLTVAFCFHNLRSVNALSLVVSLVGCYGGCYWCCYRWNHVACITYFRPEVFSSQTPAFSSFFFIFIDFLLNQLTFLNDIFNISPQKNKLITQQYVMFMLRLSPLIISPWKMRKHFLPVFGSIRLRKCFVLWAEFARCTPVLAKISEINQHIYFLLA